MGETAGDPAAPPPVYVDGGGLLGVAHSEATGGHEDDIWAGWSAEDRARVEAVLANGRRQLDEEPKEHGVLFSPDARAGALLQSVVSELVDRQEVDEVLLETGVREARYDNRDARWVRSLFGLLREALEVGRFEWRPPGDPLPIPNGARVALLGDWGSGLYGAPLCASSIAADPDGFAAVVHLGDIYYTGSRTEVQRNFLQVWPDATRQANPATVFRACNGNHEMYSGGRPYAEHALAAFDQPSSAFAMENDSWLLVGLDTAYDEWELGHGQDEWLRGLLARPDGRRALLFSHHQPFSHFSAPKRALHDAVTPIIESFPGKVHAWYWGHEHLAALYDVYEPWGLLGRCTGHSGFPYFRDGRLRGHPARTPHDAAAGAQLVEVPAGSAPAALVADGPNPLVAEGDEQERYGPHGYITLDLGDGRLGEQLRAADGRIVWSNEP